MCYNSFAGQITVNPSSNITYKAGSSSVTLCDNSDFNQYCYIKSNWSGLVSGFNWLITSVSGSPIEITIKRLI